MKHYLKIVSLLFIILLFSCKNKTNETAIFKKQSFDFKYKTFIEIENRNGEFVIYDPCDGPIRKLKWNSKDELEIIEVVENDLKTITKSENLDDSFRIYYGDDEYYDFKVFDKEQHIFKVTCKRNADFANEGWGIPPYVVDSEMSKKFKIIKQPCLECYTKEQCIALGELSAQKKSNKGNEVSDYLVYKKAKIIMKGKEIEISIPFVKEHVDYKGDTLWGEKEISSALEVKLLKSKEENLYFVFGEGKCGACPNFSALYNKNGENLFYNYSVRLNVREAKNLLSKGNDDKIFSDYGLSDKDINIQINDPNTPTYIIKNWY